MQPSGSNLNVFEYDPLATLLPVEYVTRKKHKGRGNQFLSLLVIHNSFCKSLTYRCIPKVDRNAALGVQTDLVPHFVQFSQFSKY